jgi:hypothetical protein
MHFSAPLAYCDLSQASVCILHRQILSPALGLPEIEVSEEPAVFTANGIRDDVWDEDKLFESVQVSGSSVFPPSPVF